MANDDLEIDRKSIRRNYLPVLLALIGVSYPVLYYGVISGSVLVSVAGLIVVGAVAIAALLLP